MGVLVIYTIPYIEFCTPPCDLVAEGIHFTLFGIVLPTIELEVYTFRGLMNSTKVMILVG